MKVYTLTSLPCCGSRHILGVYDSWEAVMNRLSWVGEYIDPDDEYRIECFELQDAENTATQAESVTLSRLKYQRERDLIEANKNNNNTES